MARTFAVADYIDIAANAALDDSIFSLAFWWKCSSDTGWEIVGRHDATSSRNGFGLYRKSGSPSHLTLYAKPNSATTWEVVVPSVSAVDGNWHAAVARVNRNTTLDLMVDGVSGTQAATSAWGYNASIPARLGKSTDSFWTGYIGDMANFAWWNGRLTDDECLSFCKGVSPGAIRPSALRVWMPMRN